MKKALLAIHRKQVSVFGYLPMVFLFLFMSACFPKTLPAGKVGQPSPVDNMNFPYSQGIRNVVTTSGDACPTREEIIQKVQKLQMPFIANDGQTDERVKFYSNTFGGTVFVTKDGEIVYTLPDGRQGSRGAEGQGGKIGAAHQMQEAGIDDPDGASQEAESRRQGIMGSARGIALKEELVGGKIHEIKGEEKAVTKVSYFKGNDPSKWRSEIATYQVVDMGEVYEGIDLSLRAHGNNVEKLFCVKPGASPEQIKISLSGIQPLKNPPPLSPSVRGTGGCPPLAGAGGGLGARGLFVNEQGELEAETGLGTVKFTKPVAYQEIDGKRVEVSVEYSIQESAVGDQGLGIEGTESRGAEGQGGRGVLETQNSKSETRNSKPTYSFKVAAYDKTKDLIIDPLLASTYLGGSFDDRGNSVAIDAGGNVYVAGYTNSTDFPTTPGAYQGSYKGGTVPGGDVFVSRLSGDLTKLLASTYLGGSSDDYGWSVAIDTGGNVYVTGYTYSADFPTTPGAYQTFFKGGYGDVFVSRLSGDLTKLLASTYLGGSSEDYGHSVAIDAGGNVYVTGHTQSTDFPTTPGAYQTSKKGSFDVFVSRLSGDLTKLLASTYLGGNDMDVGQSVAIDAGGNVYITGWTFSTDFPTTLGAYQTSKKGYKGSADVFVSRLSGDLTKLLASTYLGSEDYGYSVAIDAGGNVYITGWTLSTDFPTTPGAYQTSNKGSYDVFVSRLDANLSSGTDKPPTVTTGDAADITLDAATLKGVVNANGLTATAWFEYGATSGGPYDHTSDTQTVTGSSDTPVSIGVSGLSAKTTYYYKIVAKNSAGKTSGSEMSFTTLQDTPPPFLSFPVQGYSAYNAPISSVFDHSMGLANCPDPGKCDDAKHSTVVAYTDERGTFANEEEKSTSSKSCDCGIITTYSFFKSDTDKSPFVINGNYKGTVNSGSSTLNYDGHNGIDYKFGYDEFGNGTPLQASVSGTVTYIQPQVHTLEIDPKDGSGYKVLYTHLSSWAVGTGTAMRTVRVRDRTTKKWIYSDELCPKCPKNGDHVNRGQFIGYTGDYGPDKNGKGKNGGVPAHLHFGVHKKVHEEEFVVDPYGWDGLPGTDPYTQSPYTQFHPGVVNYRLWLPPPKVTTGQVIEGSVTATSAKLSGTVNPMGLTTTAWFEGSAKSGSYTKKSMKKTISGSTDKTGSFTVYGLKPGTKYYYRIAAQNDAGTSYGSELSFTTLSK